MLVIVEHKKKNNKIKYAIATIIKAAIDSFRNRVVFEMGAIQ